jgi:dienelactone hydrolase
MNKKYCYNISALVVLSIFMLVNLSSVSNAEILKNLDCNPQAIKSPIQKGLAIVGELSGFDPCNSSVELFKPNTTDNPPIVIVAHGGGGKRDAQNITREFQKLGFGTLIFDAYEMNGIPLGRIGNASRQMMILKTTYAAYEWILKRSDFNTSAIYFYGISNGASVVINIAGMVDKNHVKGIISEAPTPTGIGYPNEISIPIQIIFGELDDLGAPVGKKRWEIQDLCRISVSFDFAPKGTSKDCNYKTADKSKRSISTIDWTKSVIKTQSSFIDIVFIENMAHGGFTKELNINTRDFGRGPIGWSEGGTPDSRNKMLEVINQFIKKL